MQRSAARPAGITPYLMNNPNSTPAAVASSSANDKKRLQTVNGVSLSNLKKIGIYDFGSSNVHSIEVAANNKDVSLLLTKKPEDWQIKRYEEFWGVKIKIVTIQ